MSRDRSMPEAMDYRAGRKFRIPRPKEISRVFREGRRATDGVMTLLAAPNGLAEARFAPAIATKHGNAVRRSRLKRLCREAFRLSRPELPAGWDYVILPRRGISPSLETLRESLRCLSLRVTGEQPPPPRGTS